MARDIYPIPNTKHARFRHTTIRWLWNSSICQSPYLVYWNKIIWHQIRLLRF